jgi:Sec-independent protein translocase protein TatA
MELLGIGLPELFFIVILILLILGPKDMISAGKTIGRTLRKFVMSPEWQAVRKTGQELQQLPTKLMREANLEELQALESEIKATGQQLRGDLKSVSQQIQPPDFKASFDERQVLGGSSANQPVEPSQAAPDTSTTTSTHA